MAKFQPLPVGGEDNAVLAGHVPAAQTGEANLTGRPRTGDAAPAGVCHLIKIPTSPLRRGLAEQKSCP